MSLFSDETLDDDNDDDNDIDQIIDLRPVRDQLRTANLRGRQVELHLYNKWPLHAFDFPQQVYPNIWVSGIGFNSTIPKWCKENGVYGILNAAGHGAREHYDVFNQNEFFYMELNMIDKPDYNPVNDFETGNTFLKALHQNNYKILVHCMWGQSRSVSCLIYFMIKSLGYDYKSALKLIRKNRPEAKPNSGFKKILKSLK